MRKFLAAATLAAITGCVLPSPAFAAVIDFEAASTAFPPSYEEDGFFVVSEDHLHFELSFFPDLNSQNGTTALGNHHFPLSVRRLDGSPFSFYAFDAAEFFIMSAAQSGANNQTVIVKGSVVGGGVEWASFDLDFVSDGIGGEPDFETFVLPSSFQNLELLEFSSINGPSYRPNFYQLDNLRMDEPFHAPEPTSLILLGTGLALTCRRFRRANRTPRRLNG